MADSRFYTVAGPFSLARLAEISGATFDHQGHAESLFSDVAPLDNAGPSDVSFLDNRKYAPVFEVSKAGVCVVSPEFAGRAPAGMLLLVSADPYRAYARIAQAFYPVTAPVPWVAPTAWVDPTASVGEGCRLEPGVVIGARAELGRRCRIGANAVIGDGVVVAARDDAPETDASLRQSFESADA